MLYSDSRLQEIINDKVYLNVAGVHWKLLYALQTSVCISARDV